MKFSTSAYFLLCGLLPIWQGTKAADVRCFPEVHCEGGLIQTVFTPRECCIENAIGMSYAYSGQNEKCHTCEVIGWKQAHVYAIEDSVISIPFGANRGAAESRYIFNVEYISNEANATMLDQGDLISIVYSAIDIEVKVRLPRYSSSDRYTAKNTTLRMAKQLPANLSEAQFIYPEEVTLHVIVPAVSIERSSYSIEYSENLAVPVCLSYDNTGGGHAQFSVNVSVTGQDGGFSKTHRFGFTAHSGSSCDSVSLPLSAIHDPFTDTVFSVAIVHQDQPPFDLGPNSSVSLTVKALIALSPSGTVITVKLVETASNAIIDERNYTITYPTSTLTPIATPTEPDGCEFTCPVVEECSSTSYTAVGVGVAGGVVVGLISGIVGTVTVLLVITRKRVSKGTSNRDTELSATNVVSESRPPAVVYETVSDVVTATGPDTSENVAYGVSHSLPITTQHNPAYGHITPNK